MCCNKYQLTKYFCPIMFFMFYKIKKYLRAKKKLLSFKLVVLPSLGQTLDLRWDLNVLLPALSFSKCQTCLHLPNTKKIDVS